MNLTQHKPVEILGVAVLTVSDRCARGEAADLSGPTIEAIVEEKLGEVVTLRATVPDERPLIVAALRGWLYPKREDTQAPGLILTTGGTGFSPRDVTPEAVLELIERRADGLMELARSATASLAPAAYLSRGVAGLVGHSLIITLPGSPRGASQQLVALLPLLAHAVALAAGRDSPHPLPPNIKQ